MKESAGMAANLSARRVPLANGSSPAAAAAVDTVVTLNPRNADTAAADSNVIKVARWL